MSYDLHILRVPESKENQISADEWINCIESDPELQRNESSDSSNRCIIATVVEAEEWESLRWNNGSISASYPQSKMLSKMSAIAQRLGAVIMSDDGDIWNISENGRVVVDSPEKNSETVHNAPHQDKPPLRGEI